MRYGKSACIAPLHVDLDEIRVRLFRRDIVEPRGAIAGCVAYRAATTSDEIHGTSRGERASSARKREPSQHPIRLVVRVAGRPCADEDRRKNRCGSRVLLVQALRIPRMFGSKPMMRARPASYQRLIGAALAERGHRYRGSEICELLRERTPTSFIDHLFAKEQESRRPLPAPGLVHSLDEFGHGRTTSRMDLTSWGGLYF